MSKTPVAFIANRTTFSHYSRIGLFINLSKYIPQHAYHKKLANHMVGFTELNLVSYLDLRNIDTSANLTAEMLKYICSA